MRGLFPSIFGIYTQRPCHIVRTSTRCQTQISRILVIFDVGNEPPNAIMEALVRLETFVDDGASSSESEIDRVVHSSRRRPFLRGRGRGLNSDVERCATDPRPRWRLNARGRGCVRLVRLTFASAVGFFIAM
jgi:hypothetical protein